MLNVPRAARISTRLTVVSLPLYRRRQICCPRVIYSIDPDVIDNVRLIQRPQNMQKREHSFSPVSSYVKSRVGE